ncbi:ATP-dependent Clp protease adaptor ClpS [Allokutzneria oryzae]|uniref:ATP-dependent Clp protease adaptor ClpS n=1 Tax=Allokutzneria oryzae TaxID=1378989 RepID=A0ABV6A0P3_9PSEU
MNDASWRVLVWDDDVNTTHVVQYVLYRVCGMTLIDAARTMITIHQQGYAEVARFPERADAERLVSGLMVCGLRGGLARAEVAPVG